jgi:hypothetical protein
MKTHSFVRVVRMWCEIHTVLILRCVNNSEGLNCWNILVGVVPEFTN